MRDRAFMGEEPRPEFAAAGMTPAMERAWMASMRAKLVAGLAALRNEVHGLARALSSQGRSVSVAGSISEPGDVGDVFAGRDRHVVDQLLTFGDSWVYPLYMRAGFDLDTVLAVSTDPLLDGYISVLSVDEAASKYAISAEAFTGSESGLYVFSVGATDDVAGEVWPVSEAELARLRQPEERKWDEQADALLAECARLLAKEE